MTPSILPSSLAHILAWYITLSKLWWQWLDQDAALVAQRLPQSQKIYPSSLPWAEQGRVYQEGLD